VTFPRFRRPSGAATFRFPLPCQGRLALVDTALQGSGAAANFTSTDLSAIETFAPESIALPLSVALAYAMRGLAEANFLPSLRSAIVVLSSLHTPCGPMTDGHRDLLWRAFGLPVFEQLLGPDGLVIASECEVHNGLHADGISEPPAGYSAEIVTGPCDCGLETPRLRHIVRLRERTAVAAA
jgi:hypothetical protein